MFVRGIILTFFVFLIFHVGAHLREQRDQQDLSMDCGSIYKTTVTFPAKTLDVVNISIPNSHNASIRIQSSCCEQIKPSDVACSPCSESGGRTCFVNQSEVISLHTNIGENCLNETIYYFTCHAQLCNGSFSPGYQTECLQHANETHICLNDGSWETLPCTSDVARVTSTPNHSVGQSGSSQHQPLHALTSTCPLKFQTTNASGSQFVTALMNPRSSIVPHASNVITAATTNEASQNSTIFPSIDDTMVKKEMMHFLIAFCVILGVVFLIVCGFFIRKSKSKERIDDLPLEYWHETEYIEAICGKGSSSINPLPNDKGESRCLDRYKHGSGFGKQTKNPLTENVDVPRRMKNDTTDRYVTTATGSNFYSYRASPDVDLGDPESEISSHPGIHRDSRDLDKMASFKPRYSKKQHRSGKQRHVSDTTSGKTGRSGEGHDDIYAVSYKNRLRNSLDDWSAEESDV